ncbi:helix-turn-helix domain-containing protein [Sorangium sp. So ce1000]|uniref:helix-turn-helix domain-containing protein n=1 Tax=Sorangium sp. So ce1000 TaxID=3133325 RepID=UPI003F63BB5E
MRYGWPGNVRELRNVMERAAVLTSGDLIELADLPTHLTGVATSGAGAASAAPDDRPSREPAAERQRIIDALERCAGNQTRAAKLLGISLRTLVNRLSEYDVPRPRKKP